MRKTGYYWAKFKQENDFMAMNAFGINLDWFIVFIKEGDDEFCISSTNGLPYRFGSFEEIGNVMIERC